MKAGWETKKLGEIIQLEYGKPLADSDRNPNGLYPAYGANGIKDRTDKFYKDAPSIIVGRKGSAGEVTLTEEKYWPLDVTFFVEFDRTKYELQYLYFLLLTLNLPSMAKGVKPGINRNDVYDITVTTPDIEEQRRIVTLLDEAFADIATTKASAEKNLQNARTLFISHLQSSYHQQGAGWTSARIADIAKHSLGKMLDKAKNRGNLKPYLRNLNVRWFDFDLSDVQEMKFTPEESDKYTAIKGDVLICEGGYPGRCAIWEDDEPIYFQKALHRVRFHNTLHSKWFVNYLYLMDQTGDLKHHFSGTGIQHFTGEALAKFTLPIPPDQQIQQLLDITNQLETEVVRLESIYHQKLTALDDLKKSLLHQAFSGQLCPLCPTGFP